MKFEVGEIAIALSNSNSIWEQPRTRGASYVVLAIAYCPKCGRQAINVSGASTSGSEYTRCINDHRKHNEGLWWTDSERFTKPEFISETIEQLIQKEDYELVEILTKIKKL